MSVAWPLTTEIQTDFNPAVRFEARRPWSATKPQTRKHAGVDLRAKEGALIVAPEPCVIVAVDRGWDGTAKATLVHTASGHSLLLGCTALGSAPPVGTNVPTGGVLAAVGYYTKTDGTHSSMLHLQVYNELISPAQANARQSWAVNAPRPQGLIDPLVYLSGAELLPPTKLPDEVPPGPLVAAGDGRTGVKPCHMVNGVMVCSLPDVGAWVKALASYRKAAEPLIVKANELVLTKKLLKWTPAASDAIDTLGDADLLLNDHANQDVAGLPDDQVAELVSVAIAVRQAIEVLIAFVGQKLTPPKNPEPTDDAVDDPTPPVDPKPKKPAKRKGSGGLLFVGATVLLLGGGAAYYATRRRRAA